jgi:hypothetical protein
VKGILLAMNRTLAAWLIAGLVLTAALGAPAAGEAADATVTSPDGATVIWSEWLHEHGPVALVLWSSWAPGADETLLQLDALAEAAGQRRMELVLVAVQEPFEDASRALGGVGIPWFHDRFGRLLKDCRVVAIPALVVVAADGRVAARLDPDAASLRGWKAE